MINLSLLFVFASSLFFPPPIIEKLARLKEPNLPEKAINYTRKLTKIWCFFFIFNGTIALITVFMSDKVWTIYNGFISYILVALFFGVEFCFRLRLKNAK